MKKFLSLLLAAILVMAMSTVVFADEVDLGMTGNGTVDLSSYTAGTIKVKAYRYQYVNADVDANWGVGGLCATGEWEVKKIEYTATLPSKPAEGDEFEFTWDIAAVKADLGDQPNVNFYNDMKVKSVVIVTEAGAAAAGDATPITAIAIIALASCAAMVVLRKREA
ncbi:MAG: hypothetical protein IKS10_09895 [Lachnospiraceae bacterium]|nr:hypothetical protein [Lachnospiraceae bacterium]